MTIRFLIRTSVKFKPTDLESKVPLSLRFKEGTAIDKFLVTKIMVNPNLWDTKNQQVKSRMVCDEEMRQQVDSEVTAIRRFFEDAYQHDRDNIDKNWPKLILDKYYNPSKYKQETVEEKKTLLSLYDYYLEMHPLSDIRIRNNRVVMRVLQRYELFVRLTHPRKRKFTLYIDDVDNAMLHDIWKYVKNEHVYRDNYPELFEAAPEKRPSKPRGENTLIDYFCKIRTFFRWCYDNGLTQNRPFDKFHLDEPVYGTPVFITLEERDKLLDADFADDARLAMQRDIFVFQTLIGCRVSDLYALTRDNIINDAVEYIAGKTVDGNPRTIRVPLNSISRGILDKYKHREGKKLFPFTAQQDYNEDIKEVFKRAGLDRMVTILNPTTRRQEQKNLYEVASSHMARRTFVGNLYLETKDKGLVATLSGHDPNSDAFNRYWAPNEEVRLEMIEKLERVKEKTPMPNATRQQNNVHPVHPGSILRRQIEAHGYNTRDLAMLIGSTKELLDGIVAEQEALTMDIAQGLEMVLGVSAAMWMNLQKAYDQAMSV